MFEDALVESLALADVVFLAGVFKSESIPEHERLVPEAVVAKLMARGTTATALPDAQAIVGALAPRLKRKDVVAIMSNGGFGNIYKLLPDALASLVGAR